MRVWRSMFLKADGTIDEDSYTRDEMIARYRRMSDTGEEAWHTIIDEPDLFVQVWDGDLLNDPDFSVLAIYVLTDDGS